MPSVNPFIDMDAPVGAVATPTRDSGSAPAPAAQAALRNVFNMNPFPQADNGVNAAGTSENVALHVAMLVAFALIGVYVFRASGFRFVMAASAGAGIGAR